jgi:alkylation response protein AidB-like acyl-CoA dehydrogenase
VTSPPPHDLRAIARSLRPIVEREADPSDVASTMTEAVDEAIAASGLNHLQVPRELGGFEADVDTTLDVIEELAHQDGSIGWTVMANANATAMCSMFDPEVAREMLVGHPEVVCAGQFVSRGKAKRAEGGFVVGGRFQFGSGTARATWIGGGALLRDPDGELERNDAGVPRVLAFVVPREAVELTGNWDVMGLRGTGSFDYTIPEQFVDDGRTFWLFDGEPRSGGGVYRLGVVGFAGIGHAGWALGVARRALDEIQQILASGRSRIGGGLLRDDQVIQRSFSQQALALRSVRLLVHDTIGRIVAALDAGDPMTKAMVDELVSAVTYQTGVCHDVVHWAYMTSGSAGLRNPSVLQRCFRDMTVGAAHIYVDPRSHDEVGKALLAPPS